MPDQFTAIRQIYVNGVRGKRATAMLVEPTIGQQILPPGVTYVNRVYSNLLVPGLTAKSASDGLEAVYTSRWEIIRCPVERYDPVEQTLQLNFECGNRIMSLPATLRYSSSTYHFAGLNWLENAPEFIDEPGEWAFNRTEHSITYKPRPNEVATVGANVEIVIPTAEALMTLDNVNNVTIEGFQFSYAAWNGYEKNNGTRVRGYTAHQAGEIFGGVGYPAQQIGAALSVSGGMNVKIVNNNFKHLGGAGLFLGNGIVKATVTANTLTKLSANAIQVGQANRYGKYGDCGQTVSGATRANSNMTITNNVIDTVSLDYWDNPAITILCLADSDIVKNDIRNVPYSGISYGVTNGTAGFHGNSKIHGNYITKTMLKLEDGGAIYTRGDGFGTKIYGNHIDRTGSDPAYSVGIYLDQESAGYRIYGNRIVNPAATGRTLIDYFFRIKPIALATDKQILVGCPENTNSPPDCVNNTGIQGATYGYDVSNSFINTDLIFQPPLVYAKPLNAAAKKVLQFVAKETGQPEK